ncbi:MAG: trigger factor [Oligoflexia bacterium]|nr:MAG: trigger factor [Oligoflexia bacterium]
MSELKTNLEKVSNLERRLNIEVPAAVVGATFEKVLKSIQKQAHIKGFRPGKAPLATIKSVYGDRAKQDVVEELVQKHYYQALKQHSLEPINYPEFEFDTPIENADFSFSAHFEVKPEITLKKYEGLSVVKEAYAFDQKRMDQILENIKNSRATTVDVLEDRPAQMGDIAVIDFVGTIDGKPLQGGTGTDHNLELGAKQFIEGFEDGVVGMKVGSEKTLHLKFPTPYHSDELAGKAVDFKVTLKALKKKELPEINDEFVKTMGYESAEALMGMIRDDIEGSEKKRIEQDFKNRLLKALVDANPVEVPPSMQKEQKQALIEDMKKKMAEQGMGEREFAEYEKKWDLDFETTAKEMIQAGFIVDAIAKKHELQCNKDDIDAKLEEYAKQTGLEKDRIREFYAKPEQAQRLAYMITEDKVIDFVLKSTKVKEVSKSEIKESAN